MVGHRQGRYRISALVRKLLLLSTHWRNVPRPFALRRTFARTFWNGSEPDELLTATTLGLRSGSGPRRRVFSLQWDVTPGGQPASRSPWKTTDDSSEHAQQMAGHESPRTTKLYDRTKDEITLSEVERIRL